MRNFFFIVISVFVAFSISAQQGDKGIPASFAKDFVLQESIATYQLITPNIDSLKKTDKINDSLGLGPWRFGYNYETSLHLNNSGTWITKENGDLIWLLDIKSKDAQTINITLKNSFIPEGNELYVYDKKKTTVLGKFTQKHLYKGELGVDLIAGNELIVEYVVPYYNAKDKGKIEVSRITYGYRTQEEVFDKAFGSSASCEMNVNCPDGSPYVNQRNSVVMLVVGGNGFCTGTLVNNTSYDQTPYVLTANHCYNQKSDVTSWVFRFNWQSPNCSNPSTSPAYTSLSGSELKARRAASDFCLVEITGGLDNGKIPASYMPYFAGWDSRDIAPSSSFCIHHPKGDIKKISFADSPALKEDYPNSSHEPYNSWMVYWDRGTTTESASSGSPLFNQNGRLIGQLWGGNASCSNSGNGGRDYYGRVHNSWEPAGSNSTNQLKFWLDPTNTGELVINGLQPLGTGNVYDAALIDILGTNSQSCTSSFYPKVVIANNGSQDLTSLTIEYTYNDAVLQQFSWSGNLAQYQMDTIVLPEFINREGNNKIEINLVNPNGNVDENPANSSGDFNFTAQLNKKSVEFMFYTGCFSNEVSWKLIDESNTVLYSGGNYPAAANLNYLIQEEFCLTPACYRLILMDSGDDGVSGAIHVGCDFTGSMTLKESGSDTLLAELKEEDADFGSSIQFDFCMDTSGLKNNFLHGNFAVYPNPARENLKIDMNFKGEKTIYLQNIIGEVVKRKVSYHHTEKMDVSDLAQGVYYLVLHTNQGIYTKKIIVQ